MRLYVGVLAFLDYSIDKNCLWCLGLKLNLVNNQKEMLWANFALFFAMYFLFHSLTISFIRIGVLKMISYNGEEPKSIRALNVVISNTTEHCIIFAGLLFAGLTMNPLNWTFLQFVHIVRLFIIGRALYGVGFLTG